MKTIALTLALIAGLSMPAMAQTVAPGWKIVHGDDQSRIAFEGTQMGAPFEGNFREFDGKINFDAANLAGSSADITIHLGSVEANSPDRNKYLSMPDWFNTDAFPDARFVTTSIEKGLDLNQYVAKGSLTIRDKTLPVVLPFTLTMAPAQQEGDTTAQAVTAVMEGETSINRLDYGVGQGQWQDTKSVGAEVRIKIKVTATKVP